MEMDLDQIKKISKRKVNENYRFRTFLKSQEVPDERIDDIVKVLYKQVYSEIDCIKCANCCRTISPGLDDEDIIRLSESLRMPEDLFREEYLVKEDDSRLLYFKNVPCPFLDGNLCSHYDARPKDCREFPHLHKGSFNGRTLEMIDNSSVCPIVFNVLEMLKEEVWHPRRAPH